MNTYYLWCKKSSQCFTDINECESNPCQFNGTCSDEIGDYTCDCVDGFQGKSCEESKFENIHCNN